MELLYLIIRVIDNYIKVSNPDIYTIQNYNYTTPPEKTFDKQIYKLYNKIDETYIDLLGSDTSSE